MNEYPEHEKQSKVLPQSQAIGEFVEWLQCETEYVIGKFEDETPHLLYPIHISIQNLLAEFFDIDLNKLEKEKQAMIESIKKVGKI